jgi:hypothetical protein
MLYENIKEKIYAKVNVSKGSADLKFFVINKIKSVLPLNHPRFIKSYLYSLYGKTNNRFEPCQINIKMKNLKNKPIIKINDLKVKKTLLINTFLKQKNDQIKFRLIDQKRLLNTSSIYKNILEYFSVILEDGKRFNAYFKKRFPKSFKYLYIVKFVTFLIMFITLQIDYQTYSVISSSIEEESLIPISVPTKFYSTYSFCLYLVIIIYEFVLSLYVTLNSNSLVENVVFQIGKHVAKAVGASIAIAFGYSHTPGESNVVSNFVHTKTPFGRGYDYEIGSFDLKIKGDLVSGALGTKDMISAAQKHAPDSNIIDINKLNDIINDPEFKFKIRLYTTFSEKAFLSIPLIDFSLIDSPSLPTNPECYDVSDLNSFKDDNNNNNTEKSITPVIKKSLIRRHHSDPLPRRKINRPVIRRNNTR